MNRGGVTTDDEISCRRRMTTFASVRRVAESAGEHPSKLFDLRDGLLRGGLADRLWSPDGSFESNPGDASVHKEGFSAMLPPASRASASQVISAKDRSNRLRPSVLSDEVLDLFRQACIEAASR